MDSGSLLISIPTRGNAGQKIVCDHADLDRVPEPDVRAAPLTLADRPDVIEVPGLRRRLALRVGVLGSEGHRMTELTRRETLFMTTGATWAAALEGRAGEHAKSPARDRPRIRSPPGAWLVFAISSGWPRNG